MSTDRTYQMRTDCEVTGQHVVFTGAMRDGVWMYNVMLFGSDDHTTELYCGPDMAHAEDLFTEYAKEFETT